MIERLYVRAKERKCDIKATLNSTGKGEMKKEKKDKKKVRR